VIATGFDDDLDALRALSSNAHEALAQLESAEKQRTGLSSLKFGFNRIHGYYIELSRTQAESTRIPSDYQRRQTLKAVERYTMPALKTFEDQVLSAESKALAREKWLYENLVQELQPMIAAFKQLALALASLDTLNTLAKRAQDLQWNTPELTQQPGIIIHQGRHPVVESLLHTDFIANDVSLRPGQNTWLITGPNMGGKSTFMRQTALIVLLAHIGSHVPAQGARIGPIDQLFTRIGASDDLANARSTFMMEMIETAHILRHASANSLVLIDEIGRGTSTHDGMALAHACCLHLANTIGAYTLFSTHYFELTHLREQCANIKNMHLKASVNQGQLIFFYRVEAGFAHKSYGLDVAALAGIPQSVLNCAALHLERIQAASSVNT
jgi:DNA mismatch repair protein MutS